MEKPMAYPRLHPLIIDELGYMSITREQLNLLFQLISIKYEMGSIIPTGNYNLYEREKVFDDNVVLSAIIDILVHHAQIFHITGGSYRLKIGLRRLNKNGKKRGSILFA